MLKNLGLLGGVAAGLIWSAAAFAQIPIPTTFAGAPNLATVTAGTAIWVQSESTPCEGNDINGPNGIPEGGGGDDVPLLSTSFILDPGCALRASDPGASFLAYPFLEGPLGVPAGDLANGYHATLASDGTLATVTVDKNIWGPLLKFNVDTPGLVTVTAGTVSDYVFTIDVASGDVTSFSWTANADTSLGPAWLDAALLGGGPASFYSAEAAEAGGLSAAGATVWACSTGGFIAQPTNNPSMDPGTFGTCPPDPTNPSPTLTNAAYNPATGTFTSNASSAVLGITPRAWAPLDGRLSVPEPGTMLLIGSGLVGLGAFGRRKSA